jgi:ATP-binding protein involved in chromosome partitioning
MASYICPHCDKEGALFDGDDAQDLSSEKEIPYIGKIPFDTRLSRKTGSGGLFYPENKESVAGKAIASAVDHIEKFLKDN